MSKIYSALFVVLALVGIQVRAADSHGDPNVAKGEQPWDTSYGKGCAEKVADIMENVVQDMSGGKINYNSVGAQQRQEGIRQLAWEHLNTGREFSKDNCIRPMFGTSLNTYGVERALEQMIGPFKPLGINKSKKQVLDAVKVELNKLADSGEKCSKYIFKQGVTNMGIYDGTN